MVQYFGPGPDPGPYSGPWPQPGLVCQALAQFADPGPQFYSEANAAVQERMERAIGTHHGEIGGDLPLLPLGEKGSILDPEPKIVPIFWAQAQTGHTVDGIN